MQRTSVKVGGSALTDHRLQRSWRRMGVNFTSALQWDVSVLNVPTPVGSSNENWSFAHLTLRTVHIYSRVPSRSHKTQCMFGTQSWKWSTFFFCYCFWWVCVSVCVCLFFRAAPMVYGGSQARGQIGAATAGLCHSHSNTEIRAASATYTTAQGNAGSLTHWARAGIEPTSCSMPQQELSCISYL